MPQSISEWAKAMRASDNAVILVIDTAGLQKDAPVLRVLIADPLDGYVHYEKVFQPQRICSPNTAFTGITEEQLLTAPTLAEVWDDIRSYLKDATVLSYGLAFVRNHLKENEKADGLEALAINGFCMQEKAEACFGQNGWMSLRAACARIGHTVPDPAMAHERAEAIAKLLHAMAEGLPRVPGQPIGVDTVLEDMLKEQF